MKRSAWAVAAGAIGGYAAYRVYRSRQAAKIFSRESIVILGAGFAGLTAAQTLARYAGAGLRITVIDRENYHTFTPMLYEVASCSVLPYDVAVQLRPLVAAHGVEFRKAIVTGVDFDQQQVQTDTGPIRYDYLVVALGSTTNFFGNSAAEQHALTLKSLEDALSIRNHVIDTLEEASRSMNREERRMLLTAVIVGGGATGVETAGAMSDIVRHVIAKDYPTLNRSECRIVLVESGPKLLGQMDQKMASIALDQLKSAGVEVWLNSKAKSVTADRVETEDGRSISARTIIWAAGVRAPGVVANLGVAHGKAGSIQVNDFLQIPERPTVFAVGDNAQATDEQRRAPLLAAAAMQEGRAAARNIVCMLQRRPMARFRYRNLGNAVSISHGEGVAEIAGKTISGFSGWLAWRLIHLARIATFRNKAETFLDWSTAFFYDVDTTRLEMEPKKKAA